MFIPGFISKRVIYRDDHNQLEAGGESDFCFESGGAREFQLKLIPKYSPGFPQRDLILFAYGSVFGKFRKFSE